MQIVNTAPVAASATPVASPSPAEPGADSAFAKLLSAHHQPAEKQPAGKADAAVAKSNDAPEGAKKTADAEDEEEKDVATPAAVDPALAEMLAALNHPAVSTDAATAVAATSASTEGAAASGDAAASGIEALAGDETAVRGGAKSLGIANGRGDAAATRLNTRDSGAESAGLASGDAASTAQSLSGDKALAMLAGSQERFGFEQRLDTAKVADLPGLAPMAGVHSAATPADKTIAAATPLSVNMTVPATAPEFREALGVQVSVLARDGVQHAHLHLNPADMGPISVQIALQGTQAQVDFGADSSATRQIIESGLPELAAALREAGFTLSGGGVSQHPRGQADGQTPSEQQGGSRRVEADSAESTVQRRVNTRLPLGAVDLYA